MEVWLFSRVIAHHPYTILMVILIFSSTCLIVPLAVKKFPDFSDPQLGFQARGTMLAQRLIAWQNLMETSKPRGQLTDNPLEYYNYVRQLNQQNLQNPVNIQNHSWINQGIIRKKPKNKKKGGKKYQKQVTDKRSETDQIDAKNKWEELLELKNKNKLNVVKDYKSQDHIDNENFFCNSPSSAYARVVIGRNSEDTNLWSMEGVLAQCYIDAELRSNAHFPSLCQMQTEHNGQEQKCCRSWSPANYVAFLSNRSSCLGVTENDLSRVETLLQRCIYFYQNLRLTSNCAEDLNCQRHVPSECYTRNAAYHLLHYLLDIEFIPDHKQQTQQHNNQTKFNSTLKYVMIFLPIAESSATLNFYKELNNDGLSYGKFCIKGMQLGLKSTLFDRLLVSDSVLLLIGFAFVTVCIWAYTGSLLLTVTTIIAVIFSLGISYALYTLVLHIHFFPFMNLLAIVVAVGIGADDVFIYCKIWERGREQKLSNDGLVRLVQETMKHAVPSMFVTSLTTAVAFFASVVSNVTAINCFSLFSGMTVIANFFLMITWLPACVVLSEKFNLNVLSPANYVVRKIIRPARLFGHKISLGFNNFLTKTVINFRWYWLLSLGSMAAFCCFTVFHYPGLQLPDTAEFQLFDSSHTFEQYDLIYSQKFWFEKHETIDNGDVLPLRFVWGIKPIDNGNYLNPDLTGTPEWDESFDVSHPDSQLWLERFCHNLRAQPFYRDTLGPLLSNCFIESLRNWMKRRCEDPINSHINYMPCCESSTFPYNSSVLQQCAAEANAELYRTPSYLWARNGVTGGLKFLNEANLTHVQFSNETNSVIRPMAKIKVLIVEYDSVYNYSLSFSSMDQFFHQVETWMQDQLKNAPLGMRGGWFVSKLEFYELQRTLYEGTLWAMGVSLILALTVLAFVTLNPLISLYAIITIGAAIIVTVAGLILFGWKLNVLESVAVSTAIGLAIDFSLHYVVSYRACNSKERKDRVKTALTQMGGPTLMASLTSGAAGALMLPSCVLAYIQIGIFLLLVMGISWLYATFFLCPMLAVIGPSAHFAQFQYPRLNVLWKYLRKNKPRNVPETSTDNSRIRRKAKGRGMWSESTLSTSSTVCQFHCNEIEIFTRPPPSPSLPPSPSSALLHCVRMDEWDTRENTIN
ncbi:protein dispatched isoform X1 [Hylaeus anthracinus]|uniref:protein dispatched isoform X1 n=1 Tax=Hylaeus anthracinus TaxID=313031 RepID=UPI0023B9B4BF|nr:protein dispatched isoform X1 [Hylaeus anthracinus]